MCSCWYARVIQIQVINTWLLHVDAKTRVQPIAGEALVRQTHSGVVLVDLLSRDLVRGHIEAGRYELLISLASTRPSGHSTVPGDLCLNRVVVNHAHRLGRIGDLATIRLYTFVTGGVVGIARARGGLAGS